MILIISTTQNPKFWIYNPQKDETLKVKIKNSEVLLETLVKFLKRHKINLNDLKAILVNRGPGSFTGIRIGITVANTLSLVLRIPVFGQDHKVIEKLTKKDYNKYIKKRYNKIFLAKPMYGRNPHITV